MVDIGTKVISNTKRKRIMTNLTEQENSIAAAERGLACAERVLAMAIKYHDKVIKKYDNKNAFFKFLMRVEKMEADKNLVIAHEGIEHAKHAIYLAKLPPKSTFRKIMDNTPVGLIATVALNQVIDGEGLIEAIDGQELTGTGYNNWQVGRD